MRAIKITTLRCCHGSPGRERPRGSGCGRALVERLIAWARQTGYRRMLLDTLPVMDQAQRM